MGRRYHLVQQFPLGSFRDYREVRNETSPELEAVNDRIENLPIRRVQSWISPIPMDCLVLHHSQMFSLADDTIRASEFHKIT
jgi:hypothetical protein